MNQNTDTQAFGECLREWRQRRRLSQLDLALDAEISARHLSFMETGRAKPSRDMVLRLAAELEIPLRDRNVLLLAAGYAPAYADRPLDDSSLAAARAAREHQHRARRALLREGSLQELPAHELRPAVERHHRDRPPHARRSRQETALSGSRRTRWRRRDSSPRLRVLRDLGLSKLSFLVASFSAALAPT